MQDLTMSEVLKDPLIRQVLRADKVSLGAFAMLLEEAARERSRRFSIPASDGAADHLLTATRNLLQ